MAINKKLIHFKKRENFNTEVANGNILDTSIVFILDTKEIYTHGLFYDGSKVDLSNYNTKEEIAAELVKCAKISEIPTKVSLLENDALYALRSDVGIVENGVYAVSATGSLIDYNTANSTALGVALVTGEYNFMIAKNDAIDNNNITLLYWTNSTSDLSLTNYSTIDGTNDFANFGKELSNDFTTWNVGALTDFNGKANTEIVAAVSNNTRDMCTVLKSFNQEEQVANRSADWYVPALKLLALMYLNITEINEALTKIGGTTLANNYYWASTEKSSDSAWRVNFSNGRVGYGRKPIGNYVRFIRDISVSTLKERVTELESKIGDINIILESIIKGGDNTSNLFNFIIYDNVSNTTYNCIAETGMTWKEWIDSSYNIADLYSYGTSINRIGDVGVLSDGNSILVKPSDEIQSVNYYFVDNGTSPA